MEHRIYKFPLRLTDKQIIKIQGFVRTLSVINQPYGNVRTNLVLYVIVDIKDLMLIDVEVFIKGTGHYIDDVELRDFLGTVPADGFVWHVFVREEGV